MKLMTKELEKLIKPFDYSKDSERTNPIAIIKYFDPTGSWSWYVTSGEKQEDGDWLLEGAVDGFEFEYGSFYLSELEHCKDGVTGFQALPIERDLYFKPTPISELMKNKQR
jgi:hypothetical protein